MKSLIRSCCFVPIALLVSRSVVAQSAPSLPAAPSREVAAAVGANQLGFDAYARMRSVDGNLAIAPLSLAIALDMTWAGASGDNAAEMGRVLHASGDPRAVHDGAHDLLNELRGHQPGFQLSIANRLWGDRAVTFAPAFARLVADRYVAPMETVDWRHQTEAARQAVNAWVATQTENHIRDLVPPGVVTSATQLVLTNAVYFHGQWATKFPAGGTRRDVFHGGSGGARAITVPMMHLTSQMSLAAIPGGRMLELPYQTPPGSARGVALVMDIVLPDRADGLAAMEASLSESNLRSWLGRLQSASVAVTLPRFRVEGALDARAVLEQLGMRHAFVCSSHDFDAMAPGAGVCLSSVIHRVFADVNEDGTDAAAATAVIVAPASAMEVSEIRVDHPFVFIVRDQYTGAVLFMGRVTDPAVQS